MMTTWLAAVKAAERHSLDLSPRGALRQSVSATVVLTGIRHPHCCLRACRNSHKGIVRILPVVSRLKGWV